MTALPPVACLIGPTASGKSGLAMALAARPDQPLGPIEIVSMDSAMVYRGMDIGTAKPSQAEQTAVPHHLIDLREPENIYSVADFLADAQACITAIRARGARPLIVGGTMLYFKALREGLDNLPQVPTEIREAIALEAAERGWPALHAELLAIDPTWASRLPATDAQRISRGLEVYRHTQRPLSSWIAASQSTPEDRLSGLSLQTISIEPGRRSWLHERIAQRFEGMVSSGFLDEVAVLMKRPGLTADQPSMRSVGYRQAWQYLSGEIDEPAFLETGIAATRQLAKRQITWLRSFEALHRLDPEALPEAALVDQMIRVWASPA